jgi:DNA-binding IclR family transcriptional regulator
MRDHNDSTSPLDDLAHGQSDDAPRTVDAVLGQAVAVLRAFGTDDTHLTVDELVGRSGLTFGVGRQIVQALVTTRLLEPTGTSYRLSTLLFELGMRASAERGLIEVATPFLEDLYERTRETVHLGVRENLDVMYISKIGGHGFTEVPSRIGERLPLHCTAIGKVMLASAGDDVFAAVVKRGLTPAGPKTITVPAVLHAQLQTIAEAGLAYEYEESTAGIACIAAPITGQDGRVIAAVSIAGPMYRFSPEQHRGSVRAATDAISTLFARRVEVPEEPA